MDKSAARKLACPRTLARGALMGAVSPVEPTRMLSMVDVHEFLYHNFLWMEDAKAFVKNNPNSTLRDLQAFVNDLFEKDSSNACYGSFLWGYDRVASIKRALHEDAEGNLFIKHEQKWKSVFPIDRFGSLIGTTHGLEPICGYFCPSFNRFGKRHTI